MKPRRRLTLFEAMTSAQRDHAAGCPACRFSPGGVEPCGDYPEGVALTQAGETIMLSQVTRQ